ncbi:hypothetical protein [Pseudomonas aeruginosa]|uniref:hypothetical protein n=1 Tax=Pseudomonas aeruginosa TaxID=287 RepID=UPI0018F8678E|nr:hypothetical protein [Pseudomonas aeruginosa]
MQTNSRAINVHLGSELKARWIAYCDDLGKTPGAALKEAIEQQLGRVEFDTERKKYRQTESIREPTQRFEILLTLSEKSAVKQRARSEQCSMQRWIIDAIRVGLTHEPQFRWRKLTR